jgi:VanZ family protein
LPGKWAPICRADEALRYEIGAGIAKVQAIAPDAMILIMSTLGRLWHHVAAWAPAVIYAAVIFHFSSESNPLPVLTEHVWDKALHALEYAGLALLVSRGWQGEGFGRGWALVLAIVVTTLYAASDEFHQLWVPGRDSSVFDWMADAIGGAAGAVLFAAVTSVRLKPDTTYTVRSVRL